MNQPNYDPHEVCGEIFDGDQDLTNFDRDSLTSDKKHLSLEGDDSLTANLPVDFDLTNLLSLARVAGSSRHVTSNLPAGQIRAGETPASGATLPFAPRPILNAEMPAGFSFGLLVVRMSFKL